MLCAVEKLWRENKEIKKKLENANALSLVTVFDEILKLHNVEIPTGLDLQRSWSDFQEIFLAVHWSIYFISHFPSSPVALYDHAFVRCIPREPNAHISIVSAASAWSRISLSGSGNLFLSGGSGVPLILSSTCSKTTKHEVNELRFEWSYTRLKLWIELTPSASKRVNHWKFPRSDLATVFAKPISTFPCRHKKQSYPINRRKIPCRANHRA